MTCPFTVKHERASAGVSGQSEHACNDCFEPPAPEPHLKRLRLTELLATVWRNPVEAWSRIHFEQMIVPERYLLGDMILINDPAAIGRVLIENAANYRKDQLQKRIMGPAFRDSLLVAEKECWKRQRQIAAPIFTHRAVASYAPEFRAAVQELIARWRELPPESVIDVAQEMSRLSLDVLVRTIFPEGLGEARDDVLHNMRLYFDSFGRVDALDLFGVPEFIPRRRKMESRSAQIFFDNAVSRLLSDRRRILATHPAQAPNDLLTALLQAQIDTSGPRLSESAVRANVVSFIAAGHETTANVVTWTLYLLSQSPYWQRRVAEEAITESECRTITRATIDEALRLYPPIVAMSRQAIDADTLAGHWIRRGTVVIIAPYVLHRHARLWDRPKAFCPARFLPDAKRSIKKFAYLPFGAGPRTCIGSSFALLQATIVISEIVKSFNFEIEAGYRVWPLQRVTLRPNGGLRMVIKSPRSYENPALNEAGTNMRA